MFWRLTATQRIAVPAVGGAYTEGILGQPRTANPLFATHSSADLDIVSLLYSPLFKTDLANDKFFSPTLAKGVSISPDGKIYTVAIRSDFRWHDGQPLTIADVLFTIGRIQDPNVQSPYAAALQKVSVRQSGPDLLTFTLPAPSSTFLASLTWGVLPSHRWQARTNWQTMDPELVGSGPFRFKSMDRGKEGGITQLVLERFAKSPEAPRIKTLTLRFFPSLESAIAAFERRKIDGLLVSVSPAVENALKRRTETNAITLALPEYTAFFFNPREQPIFADGGLRRALAHALPKERIVKEVFGNSAEVAAGIFTPALYPLPQPRVDPPDRASIERELLKSGWKLVDGVRMNQSKKVLRFSITTPDVPSYRSAAEAAAASWKSYGANVEVRSVGSETFLAAVIRPRAYDVLLYGQNLGADPDPFAFLHSSQLDDPGLNLSLWRNQKGDELIDDARSQASPELRRALYTQLEMLLANDAPAAILAHPKILYLLPKQLLGVTLTTLPTPADRFTNIANWYLKTSSQWKFFK